MGRDAVRLGRRDHRDVELGVLDAARDLERDLGRRVLPGPCDRPDAVLAQVEPDPEHQLAAGLEPRSRLEDRQSRSRVVSLDRERFGRAPGELVGHQLELRGARARHHHQRVAHQVGRLDAERVLLGDRRRLQECLEFVDLAAQRGQLGVESVHGVDVVAAAQDGESGEVGR